MNEERNLRKTRVGIVVSDKMDKTVVVKVEDRVQHPLYKKINKRTEDSKRMTRITSGIGDRVEIMKPDLCLKTNTGEFPRLSRRPNNKSRTERRNYL